MGKRQVLGYYIGVSETGSSAGNSLPLSTSNSYRLFRSRNRPAAISVSWVVLAAMGMLFPFSGCIERTPAASEAVLAWGKLGLGEGRFQKPRAIAIDADNQLYIVDMTARIQVFDADGNYLRGWQTPLHELGRPCGLSISREGLLVVADTHYHRVLFYTPAGELLDDRTLGGEAGRDPGQFGFVTDVAEDSLGNWYVSEYGDFDRIQKFDPEGTFMHQWGGHGEGPGQFLRPQGLWMDDGDWLWVADASNHRIQVFDVTQPDCPLVRTWGTEGDGPGELRYPYDLFVDGQGRVVVCEFGNNRIQWFTPEGKSLGIWGGPGREPGQLAQPWDMSPDSSGRIHVLDSYNHRVQRLDGEVPQKPPAADE